MNGGQDNFRLSFIPVIVLGAAILVACENIGAQPIMGAPSSGLRRISVTLGGKTVQASVADTDASRREGLLNWTSISEDAGMLLDFGNEGSHAIHMQGMRFPIDAVWIDSRGRIKLIYEDIQPDTGQIYPSMFPSKYCLELKSGFAKRHGLETGGVVIIGGSPAKP